MSIDLNKIFGTVTKPGLWDKITAAIQKPSDMVEASGLESKTKVRILGFWGFKLLIIAIVIEVFVAYLGGLVV